jgi:hypothetical protein
MASATYEEARRAPEAIMAGGVKLVFPAFDDLTAKTVYYGTSRFEADGEEYVSALADMPYVRSQRGLAQDGAGFAINDARSEIYAELKPYEDVLEDTEVVIKECLKTKLDIFESEIVHNGFLESMNWSDAALGINCSSVSDMSRTGNLTGGRILTQRYCAAIFNLLGLKSPLIDSCGWQTAQGGNPVFCTHKYEGADGCVDHNNAHRYYAVEALSTAPVQTYEGAVGGFEYGPQTPQTCFTPQTLIWMGDGSYKPIWKVKTGDLVWSFKPSGELVKARVSGAQKHLANGHLSIDFGKDRILEPTGEHPFLIAPGVFKNIGEMDAGNAVRGVKTGDSWLDFIIRNNWYTEKRTRVHNFEVEDWETYFVAAGDIKLGVHNKNGYQENHTV